MFSFPVVCSIFNVEKKKKAYSVMPEEQRSNIQTYTPEQVSKRQQSHSVFQNAHKVNKNIAESKIKT